MRKKLADGTIKEYAYERVKAKASPYDRNSVAGMVHAYEQSPEFSALSVNSQKRYRTSLKYLAGMKKTKVEDLKRRDLLAIRDPIAKNIGHGSANNFTAITKALFKWAVDHDIVPYNIALGIRLLPGGHLPAWTWEQALRALRTLPEPLRRVVMLGMYTGQRRGDMIALRWSAYDGQYLRVLQEKTMRHNPEARPMEIRVTPELKEELDAWKKTATSTLILTQANGTPWRPGTLSEAMTRELQRNGFPPHLNVHGLRKLVAATLANEGATAHMIASVTGHKSLKMIQLYTASSDQKALAETAVLRFPEGNVKPVRKVG